MSDLVYTINYINAYYDTDGQLTSIYVDYEDSVYSKSGYGEGIATQNNIFKEITGADNISKFIIEEFNGCPQDFMDYALRIRKANFYKDVLNE